jgi:hypothetical protein
MNDKLSDDQQTIVRIITTISASLGLLGALITIISVIAFKHLHTAIARLIFCMAIADFVGILAKAVGRASLSSPNMEWLCQLQGALMQWGDLSSIFWTVMISLNLLFIMYFKKALEDVKRYEKFYMVFCFIVPIPMGLVPVFMGRMNDAGTKYLRVYGDADLWCWIGSDFQEERLYLFYGPLWCVFLFNTITYLAVGALIWKMASNVRGGGAAQTLQKRKYIFGKNTSLYLLAFLITWTPSTINRLYQMLYPGAKSFPMSIMMAICSPARGLTNFFVYFYLTWYVQVKENKTRHPHMDSSSSEEENSQYPKTGVESSILVTGRGLSGIESEIGIDSNGYERRMSKRWVVAQQAGIYMNPQAPSTYLTANDQRDPSSFYTATQGRPTISSQSSPLRERTTSELYEAQSYAETADSITHPPALHLPTVQVVPSKSRSSSTRQINAPVRMAGLPLSEFGVSIDLPASRPASDMFVPTSFPSEQGDVLQDAPPAYMQITSRAQKRTPSPP